VTARTELGKLLAEMAQVLEERDLGPVDLYLLGGCALVLFDDRAGATKDLDVVSERLHSSDADAAVLLLDAFGKSSERVPYLDPVPGGLPPLPLGWANRAVSRPSPSPKMRMWSLDPADIIVTKLRRWHPRDRADIRHICDRHPTVRDRLADVSENDFFEVDWWEQMEPRRDHVLAYLDGELDEI
jgi:hypothetical protein